MFTGKLTCLTRRVAQAKVRELGGETAADVSHRTPLLVAGDEGFLSKMDKSQAHGPPRRRLLRSAGKELTTVLAGMVLACTQEREGH